MGNLELDTFIQKNLCGMELLELGNLYEIKTTFPNIDIWKCWEYTNDEIVYKLYTGESVIVFYLGISLNDDFNKILYKNIIGYIFAASNARITWTKIL